MDEQRVTESRGTGKPIEVGRRLTAEERHVLAAWNLAGPSGRKHALLILEASPEIEGHRRPLAPVVKLTDGNPLSKGGANGK